MRNARARAFTVNPASSMTVEAKGCTGSSLALGNQYLAAISHQFKSTRRAARTPAEINSFNCFV
jgi:hypothetical protein